MVRGKKSLETMTRLLSGGGGEQVQPQEECAFLPDFFSDFFSGICVFAYSCKGACKGHGYKTGRCRHWQCCHLVAVDRYIQSSKLKFCLQPSVDRPFLAVDRYLVGGADHWTPQNAGVIILDMTEGTSKSGERRGVGADDILSVTQLSKLKGDIQKEIEAANQTEKTPGTPHLTNVRWGFAHLRRDLMLLENQIPFFVLVKLFEQSEIPFVGSREKPLTLMHLALAFLGVNTAESSRPPVEAVLDLLHLHHHYLDPGQLPRRSTDQIQNVPRMIPCATELRQAGVKFRQQDGVDSYLKVSFSEETMEISRLSVEDGTSTWLRNFIALEQCYPEVGSYFTRHGILMDNIINTESDVTIL
ncbi:hypothetical protein Taro_039016 [Colocasia esculenta]|uniref:Uncharacterized protein n=1 Tax=Colocasia esculenta TaxID=4460 RepID=A0A843WEH8_COLES|nr:hypothetical protein [Colocasia esculenta]